MFEAEESDESLAAFGFKREDFAGDAIEVWPENHQAVGLFSQISTQWRVGMVGCIGLDYGVMFQKMDRMNLSPEDYERIESDMRVLESAALAEMQRAQKEAQANARN